MLLLLISCSSPSPQAETASAGPGGASAVVYEADCEVSRVDGLEVPGIAGAAVWQAEACGGASCRPAYDSARRDGEVLHVSCDDGEETVRVVLVR